jgi:hypothetical protein
VRLSRSWANISARRRLSSKFLEPTTMRPAAWAGTGAARRRRRRRRKRIGSIVAAARALITPALFSQPPPRPPGEEGVVSLEKARRSESLSLSDFRLPSLPAGGGEAGREGLGE